MKVNMSEDNITLARFIASAIGVNPKIMNHFNQKDDCLPILYLTHPSDEKIKYYSTIGVSDFPNLIEQNNSKENIPVELLVTGYEKFDKLPDTLATCGFLIMRYHWSCSSETVFIDALDTFFPDSEMKHLLFINPFLWENILPSFLELDEKKTHFLLELPISEAEKEYKENYGTEVLMKLLIEENHIDIYDIYRKSVL